MGRNHRGAIVSVVDRASKLTRLAQIERYTASNIERELTAQLESLVVKTITNDNGREFAFHQKIAQQLNADFILPIRTPAGNAGKIRIPSALSGNTFQRNQTFQRSLPDRSRKL